MAYFIDPDGNYPRHAGDLALAHPGWDEGEALPAGWLRVAEGIIPEIAENEMYKELEPALVDGVLTRQFEVYTLPVE